MEQVVDEIAGPAGVGTSSSSAAPLGLRSAQTMGFFRTFPRKNKKCDVRSRVECEPGVALELMDAGGL